MAERVAYKDNPASYNKQCYSEWKAFFDSLYQKRITENYQLANNYSQDLVDRKNDERLSRACLFIPIVNPAILSRSAYMTNTVFSVDQPIQAIPQENTSPEIAEKVTLLIHHYLEEDKFKLTFLNLKLAEEIYPISFLKISELEEEGKVLEIKEEYYTPTVVPPVQTELGRYKHWVTKRKKWRPTITLWTQDSVFYDPSPAEWNQKTYVGTISYLTLPELIARKESMGYEFDVKTLEAKGEKVKEEDFQNTLRSSVGESKLTEGSVQYKVLENFHIVVSDDGTIEKRITTTTGDITLLDRPFPYEKLNITDLFIPAIGYPMLNQVEGNTTVDLMKYLQHGINDFFNITIDAAKYALFPPRIRDSRVDIINKEIIAPGVVWIADLKNSGLDINNAEKQLFNITPVGSEFFTLVNVLRELAEIVGGAPHDILMGASSTPSEKATKTQYRAKGISSRLAGINFLMDAELLKRLGYVLWTITLEKLNLEETIQLPREKGIVEVTLEDINGNLKFDVPHLTGIADREIKIARLEKLLVRLTPLFQHPAMLPVFYRILRKIAEAELITDFDEMFPEEIITQMQSGITPQTSVSLQTKQSPETNPIPLIANLLARKES